MTRPALQAGAALRGNVYFQAMTASASSQAASARTESTSTYFCHGRGAGRKSSGGGAAVFCAGRSLRSLRRIGFVRAFNEFSQ
jgi:hypothetical protein